MPFYGSLGYDKNRDFAPRAIDRLVALREQLRTEIPARTLRDTLLLATWNIRDFDSNKFGQGPRLEETYYYIAEVIAAFDLVAVQEVNDDLGPLERVMDILGPNWDFITTDVTEGVSGNGERTAFVFDTRKVLFRNVAGEIVLPMGQAIGGAETIRLAESPQSGVHRGRHGYAGRRQRSRRHERPKLRTAAETQGPLARGPKDRQAEAIRANAFFGRLSSRLVQVFALHGAPLLRLEIRSEIPPAR